MIDGVGKTSPSRIETARGPEKSAAAAPLGDAAARARQGAVESAVFELVQGGPPVDGGKVAAIRAAIAEGRYPVDPGRIAARMIALDLSPRA